MRSNYDFESSNNIDEELAYDENVNKQSDRRVGRPKKSVYGAPGSLTGSITDLFGIGHSKTKIAKTVRFLVVKEEHLPKLPSHTVIGTNNYWFDAYCLIQFPIQRRYTKLMRKISCWTGLSKACYMQYFTPTDAFSKRSQKSIGKKKRTNMPERNARRFNKKEYFSSGMKKKIEEFIESNAFNNRCSRMSEKLSSKEKIDSFLNKNVESILLQLLQNN